jgi:hypothetical protein
MYSAVVAERGALLYSDAERPRGEIPLGRLLERSRMTTDARSTKAPYSEQSIQPPPDTTAGQQGSAETSRRIRRRNRLDVTVLEAAYGPTYIEYRSPVGAITGHLSRELNPYRESPTPLCERLGVSPRTLLKWRQRGIALDRAEDFAARLGFHPYEVWGEVYWEACDREVRRAEARRRLHAYGNRRAARARKVRRHPVDNPVDSS